MSIAFARAKKTFLGFLQARGKALNTVKNYGCDLTELGAFCESHALDFQKLGLADLESYHRELERRGLRPNSRRRKLMTAKTFLRYLSGRMDVSTVGSEKIIPPDKVEGPPRLVPRELLETIIAAQPDTDMGWRNRALIGVLLDTGALVTEMLSLRQAECTFLRSSPEAEPTGAVLSIPGKRARSAHASKTTATALWELTKRLRGHKFFFHGYSRSGPNAERMTARGVELLFKGWAKAYDSPHLHPRTLRHLFVVARLLEGKSEHDIMSLLALRTPYAFRVYRPLLVELVRSTTQTTYSADTHSA